MVTSGGGLHVYMKTLGQMGARGRVCVTVLETTPASIGALEACVETLLRRALEMLHRLLGGMEVQNCVHVSLCV